MSELFISYSRKDSEQALQLAERLRSAGVDVWIDQHGIEAATSWSREIVHAIDEAKCFMVLISAHSQESPNVVRELSLATEANKRILPVALEDLKLDDVFRYHLAGIQRVAYTQFDAITAALHGFGVREKERKNTAQKPVRRTLMVLPFEDLSPTHDNGWFADGIVSELIDKLARVKSLKLIDRQTSLRTRNRNISVAELAQTLEVRYFIEGSIRKFEDQIKVSIGLLDFEEGEYLWSNVHRGVFSDIFTIQETVAEQVVSALKLQLGTEERQSLSRSSTIDPEAYEFYLKALSHEKANTRSGFERAISFFEEAVRQDPHFSPCYASIANAHYGLYKLDLDRTHVSAMQRALAALREVEGESINWCWISSELAMIENDYAGAEKLARRMIELDPSFSLSYSALGLALQALGDYAPAADALQKFAEMRSEPVSYWNLLVLLYLMKDKERLQATAELARPVFEKFLKLNPDSNFIASSYVVLFHWMGDNDSAIRQAEKLLKSPDLDPLTFYTLACLFADIDEPVRALEVLHRGIAVGYSNLESILKWREGYPAAAALPEYQEIVKNLQESLAERANKE